jgi:hypothetical protein
MQEHTGVSLDLCVNACCLLICNAFFDMQRYLQLEQDMQLALQRQLNHHQQQLQQQQHSHQLHPAAAAATGAASLPCDLAQADNIQAQGMMAQEVGAAAATCED